MAADESIRPEASTVHRDPDARVEPVESTTLPTDDQLVQAKTVIRGSSRAGDRIDKIERTPASVAKVLLGTRLNHFFLEELIGGGGMGAVFRARDEQLDRIVAIKVIPFVGDDPDLKRRFRNEAQSAAKLDHPRIARVFDVGNDDEWHYIVFEYIRGINIRDMVIANGVLPIDEAVFYTCQLADAIQHASDRGIVHRDIKPSNVLIGEEDTIKLVDMGLARSDNFELSEDMTASGVTLGTFDYISPEQARDPRDADLRSDIYSLGCTLYFMLSGRPPYPGGTMLQKLLSHGNAPPPDVREQRPEVSDELAAVIQKMLAKTPDDRYQSAADLIADLREVAFRDDLVRTQAVGPVPVGEISPMTLRLERHAPWLVAVSLLLITAGWLHLDSVASRQEPEVSDNAVPLAELPLDEVIPDVRPVSEIVPDENDPTASPTIQSVPPTVAPDIAADEETREGVATPPSVAADEGVEPTIQESDPVKEPGTVPLDIMDRPPLLIRVVAADSPLDYDADGERALPTTNFVEAVALAEQFGVDHVDVSVPIIESEPLTIHRDNLRITSSFAGGSLIVFEPDESVAMDRSNILSIGSNRIEFEDIHFVWKVADGEINGGAMFAINDNPLIRLTDCTITIENEQRCESVYAFDVVTDPERIESRPVVSSDRGDKALPLVAIELNNVIVRGEIGMIHMDYAAELQLNWDNGLLVISEPMIDTAGARLPPLPTAAPIQLVLMRLTAHAPLGLFRMRVGVSGADPVMVDRTAVSSVFLVDPGVPHFEFRGLSALPSDRDLLQLRGTTNAYDTVQTLAEPVLTLRSATDEFDMTRFNDLTARWPDEVSPRWSVYWSEVRRSDAPPNRAVPDDYLQNGSVRSGFNEDLLPILPEFEASSATNVLPVIGRRAAVTTGDAREL